MRSFRISISSTGPSHATEQSKASLLEHSSFSIETVGDLCYAALAAGLVPSVRPPAKDPHLLSRPLDSGAMGLLIPHVDTREEAVAIVAAIHFPAAGEAERQTVA